MLKRGDHDMKCTKCGQEIMDKALFCPYCGEKIVNGENAGENPPVENSLQETPLYTADVKNMLKSGRLAVYRDRVEFITGNACKNVFDYSALMAVKKGLDRINFITEDGRTVSCPVNRKNIHEAFVYVEQAFRPYIAEREKLLLSKGIHYSFVSTQGLNGGVLDIMEDRVEFRSKSGEGETVWYQDVKSVSLTIVALQFLLIDGTQRTFSIDREIRDKVFSFVEKATAPYIEKRKENLLARGIYYSFPIVPGQNGGTVDILADRVEFKFGSGQRESIFYQDVREARLSMGNLELALTNGTSRTFSVDRDVRDDVYSFVENAVRPYAAERTAGFGRHFGIDERIEVNEARGVFHIIRQGGKMITKEYPLSDIRKCERIEYQEEDSVLSGVLSGSRSFLSGAAGNTATKEMPNADKKIDHVGVLLTIHTEQGDWTEGIRFGNFSPAMSRLNAKYGRYVEEVSKFTDYMSENCPACELILPEIPEGELDAQMSLEHEASLAELPNKMESGSEVPAVMEGMSVAVSETMIQKDELGIKKYIEGVSRFISACETPMMIAIQGNWNNSVMKMLSGELGQYYKGNLIWYNTLQFTQADFGEGLPILVGKRLISQLGGSEDGGNERAVKAAKGIINIVSGFISQGSTDGQNLTEALFRDGSASSMERLTRVFSGMVMGRTGGGNGKVVILVDDLDRLTPAQAVELLENMKNFYNCRGCVFVVAADYDFIIRGAKEKYRQDFDESKGKDFFDKIFQVSFRAPVSGQNIGNYVKEKLEEIDICTDDEAELEAYSELVRYSVGDEPDRIKRLFHSFLLLKKMADEDMFENRNKRFLLFALLCMQTKFRVVYDLVVRRKENVTPDFLLELCSERSEVLNGTDMNDNEKTEFAAFAKVFYDTIDIDEKEGISAEECSTFRDVFAEMIELSSITSK